MAAAAIGCNLSEIRFLASAISIKILVGGGHRTRSVFWKYFWETFLTSHINFFGGRAMDILLQITFGAYVGWMSSRQGNSRRWDITLGILGAMSGSLLMNAFGMPGVSGYNVYSFIVAMFGAITVILIGRSLIRMPQN